MQRRRVVPWSEADTPLTPDRFPTYPWDDICGPGGGAVYDTSDCGRLPLQRCIDLGLPARDSYDPALTPPAEISILSPPFQMAIAGTVTAEAVWRATPAFQRVFKTAAGMVAGLLRAEANHKRLLLPMDGSVVRFTDELGTDRRAWYGAFGPQVWPSWNL